MPETTESGRLQSHAWHLNWNLTRTLHITNSSKWLDMLFTIWNPQMNVCVIFDKHTGTFTLYNKDILYDHEYNSMIDVLNEW